MFRPLRTRLAACLVFTLAVATFAAPARAAAPRVPDPAVAPLLDAQRSSALRIVHAAIWEGASENARELREAREARRHARTHRAGRPGAPGSHPRAAGDGANVPVPAPVEHTVAPGSAAPAPHLYAVPPNAICNDPSHDGTGATQSELGVAGLGNQVVVAWNNGQGIYNGNDIQGVGASIDGGLTFTAAGPPAHVGAYTLFRWIGDPVVTVNEKTGTWYVCGLARPDNFHNAIAVARGRFVGATFAMDSAWIVRQAPNSTTFLDKEWIACDSTTGNLYVTNTTFGTADTIDFYRSTNGGRSWSNPIKLSSNYDAGWVQGSRVAVAANGDVEVAWYAADQVTVESNLRFRRSTNHGTSFSIEVTPVKFNEQFGTGGPAFNRDWGPNFPSLAVDRSGGPLTGRMYLAWAECWRFLPTPVPVGPAAFEGPEPNGTAATATPFTVGQTLRGTLVTSFYGVLDQDWYSFPMTAGQSVIVYADSVSVPSGWFVRLVAPDGTQRLCRGGQVDSTQNSDPSAPSQAYYTFTAPISGTYYLDMFAQSYAPTTYEIKTAFGTPGSERGRDQRDAFVSWSDDGATWSTPVRLDDDGPGFDQVYPEVAVGSDGAAYATWYDHRDDPAGSRANVYATRSVDGGLTWAANQPLTSATSNFTTSLSNLAPDFGDYIGLANTGSRLAAAWGDGRSTSSVDAWAAGVNLTSDLTGCPADTTLAPGAGVPLTWTAANANVVFPGDYTLSFADTRGWPLPAQVTTTVPAGGSAPMQATLAVPDTAADGIDTLCATLRTPAGVLVKTCCVQVTVQGSLLAVAPGARALALSAPRPNPSNGATRLDYTLPAPGNVSLKLYDLTGARVRTLVQGLQPAGPNSAHWDGHDDRGNPVRPGAYFAKLEFQGRTLTRTLVITR